MPTKLAAWSLQLAGLVAGQRLPLSALVAALLPVFKAAEGEGASPDEAGLRSKILDIATRKAVALKDGENQALLAPGLAEGSAIPAVQPAWKHPMCLPGW